MKPQRVRGIIEYDGKFLLVKNSGSNGFWCLPGGKVNDDEDIVSALMREIIEETGVAPTIGNLVYVHQFSHDNKLGLPEFYFEITNGVDFVHLDISKTTHGQIELDEIGFIDLATLTEELRPGFLITELPDLIGSRYTEPTRVRIL